jgi:hypothetical protein
MQSTQRQCDCVFLSVFVTRLMRWRAASGFGGLRCVGERAATNGPLSPPDHDLIAPDSSGRGELPTGAPLPLCSGSIPNSGAYSASTSTSTSISGSFVQVGVAVVQLLYWAEIWRAFLFYVGWQPQGDLRSAVITGPSAVCLADSSRRPSNLAVGH